MNEELVKFSINLVKLMEAKAKKVKIITIGKVVWILKFFNQNIFSTKAM